MRGRAFGAILLVLGIGVGVGRTDDKPIDRTDLDKRIVKATYETALLGTDVFNKGNYEGCFRLYQGALMGLQPLLDHRPKLATSVKEKMEKAKAMKPVEGAFELRAALDEIQNEIAPGAKAEVKKTTLWDRLGGELGVKRVVHEIVLAAAEDKKVNFFRDGKVKLDAKGVAHLEQMLVEFISVNTGGGGKYTGKDMKTAHAGMKITEDEFNALAGIVLVVLKNNKVADEDVKELLGIIGTTKKDIVEEKGKN